VPSGCVRLSAFNPSGCQVGSGGGLIATRGDTESSTRLEMLPRPGGSCDEGGRHGHAVLMERDDKVWRQPTDAAVTRVTAEIREVSGDEDLVAQEGTSSSARTHRSG
jgi:predicted phage gp36 major capsid-like protein